MSNRFVCGFNLIILFVAFNALSMHNNKLIKSPAYFKTAKKKETQYKDVLLSCPLFVPHFKRQSVALQNNDANHYSLIFNRTQQPHITQYLLDGNPIAKLIQIDGEINFTSDAYKACNFSLQIPYHAGSLTINTQGRFIFEKKIDTHSACLTGKTIEFRDDFLSNNGLIVEANNCKTQARVECSDLLFKGKSFEINNWLITHNSLTLLAHSQVLNNGIVESAKESLIQSPLLENSGEFVVDNMRFEGNTVNNQGALFVEDTLYCASKTFNHSGILDVSNNCIMEKGDTFSSTASSYCRVKGDWKAFIDSLFLSGSFNVGNVHIVGKKFTAEEQLDYIAENAHLEIEEDVTNAGVIKVSGLLDVDSNNIKLEKTSWIRANDANLTVKQAIENEGTVFVRNHLSARAHYINNAGKIEANTAKINADRYFYNDKSSTLSAKNNLTINTNSIFSFST